MKDQEDIDAILRLKEQVEDGPKIDCPYSLVGNCLKRGSSQLSIGVNVIGKDDFGFADPAFGKKVLVITVSEEGDTVNVSMVKTKFLVALQNQPFLSRISTKLSKERKIWDAF